MHFYYIICACVCVRIHRRLSLHDNILPVIAARASIRIEFTRDVAYDIVMREQPSIAFYKHTQTQLATPPWCFVVGWYIMQNALSRRCAHRFRVPITRLIRRRELTARELNLQPRNVFRPAAPLKELHACMGLGFLLKRKHQFSVHLFKGNFSCGSIWCQKGFSTLSKTDFFAVVHWREKSNSRASAERQKWFRKLAFWYRRAQSKNVCFPTLKARLHYGSCRTTSQKVGRHNKYP